jgi:predicted dinucleotide-binding enzyme
MGRSEPLAPERSPRPSPGTPDEAARADVVLLAVGWPDIPAAVKELPAWEGRILIDATNQFDSPPPNAKVADLGDVTGSEFVASLVPGARVVKALNTLFSAYLAADPRHDAGRQGLFLAGDDADAKKQFGALVDEFGFAIVDLGNLRDGGRLMQLGGPLSGLHLLKQDV